ncbi:MAG: ABC transporter permease subunit [Gordonia sp. (in: high G+C Gram-positive bacteria)]
MTSSLRRICVIGSRVVAIGAVVVIIGLLPWFSGRDPALSILRARSAEQEATEEALAAIRADLGLDEGPIRMFGSWLGGLLRGDAGTSWNTGKPVFPGALSALGVSLTLMAFAMVVAIVIASVLVGASMRSGLRGTPRRTSGAVAAALTSLPEFLLAAVLVVAGSVWLSFPPYGWEGVQYAVLPALALGIPAGGLLGRLTADAVAVTFTESWVTMWTVAGFRRRRIATAVLRRSLPPITSQIALIMVALTGGAVAVEQVFAIPGLGRTTLGDARSQDLPALQIDVLLLLAVSALAGIGAELARRVLLGAALRAAAMPVPTGVFASSRWSRVIPAAAGGVLVLIVVVGLIGRDPYATSTRKFASPSWAEPFGTDSAGRDLLARVASGAVQTIGVSVLIMAGCLVIGLLMGLVPSLSRGFVEVTNAAPPVLAGILIAAIWGPSMAGAAVAVLVVSWAPLAAHTAALVDEAKARPYVAILPSLGAGRARILLTAVIPTVFSPILRHALLRLPGIALALAALGFLGLGPQPPTPDWGLILADGVSSVERAPWVVAAPLISLIALAIMAVGFSSARADATQRLSRRRRTPVPPEPEPVESGVTPAVR